MKKKKKEKKKEKNVWRADGNTQMVKCVWSYKFIFVCLNCQNGGSDAAVTDRGYCWGENEHFYRLTPSHVQLKTTSYFEEEKNGFMYHGAS